MAFAANYRHAGLGLLAIATSAVLVYFGNGLMPLWPLLWFAPLPVLLFASRSSWRAAALVAFFAWLLGCLNMWRYMVVVLNTPVWSWLTSFGVLALLFTLSVLLFRALLRRGAAWAALVAFPALWISLEYLHTFAWPHGTAGSLAYSQLKFLPFLQFASIAGPWGMTFLLLFFPAALAISWRLRRSAPKQALRIAGTGVGLIAAVLIFGAVRLSIKAPGPEVKVGLISSDEPGNSGIASSGTDTERLFQAYAAVAEKLASEGAQVIVLPEKLGVVVDPNVKAADAIFQSVADRTKSTIVAGMVHVAANRVMYNQARVYAPGGQPQSYDKHHMLPPFESDLKPGTTLAYWPESSATWGVAICKDMDFTPLSRQYGKAGVGLMLVPGWDFVLDRVWHGHMSIMRGVESGFSVVRAAKQAFLTVSDDRGRLLAEARSNSAPFTTLIAKVPAGHETTFYLLLGDWFAWLAIAILIFSLLRLYAVRGSRSNPATSDRPEAIPAETILSHSGR